MWLLRGRREQSKFFLLNVLFNSRGDSRDRRVCDGVCSGSSMASSMPLVDSPRNNRRNPDTCDPFVAMERDCSLFVSASHNEDYCCYFWANHRLRPLLGRHDHHDAACSWFLTQWKEGCMRKNECLPSTNFKWYMVSSRAYYGRFIWPPDPMWRRKANSCYEKSRCEPWSHCSLERKSA